MVGRTKMMAQQLAADSINVRWMEPQEGEGEGRVERRQAETAEEDDSAQ